ncbi:MAG: hypothetical protein WBL93_07130 [Lutisporaceae bacterium]
MRKRTTLLISISLLIIIAVNVYAYTSLINSSDIVLNLIKRFNFAYINPSTYFNLANKLQKKPQVQNYNEKQMEALISDKSYDFVIAAFGRDDIRIKQMLAPTAKYIKSKDGSSFIRCVENGVHVEGYMATDKRLNKTKQRWHMQEDDQTITCSMEIYIENNKLPQLWYIHFKKVQDDWRIYMLENDI